MGPTGLRTAARGLLPSRLDAAIFLLSCAVLLIELLLTRIFSVTLRYHLSFMVVSLAMLGLGAGALIVHLFPSLFVRVYLDSTLALATLLFAATAIAAIAIAFRVAIPLNLAGYAWSKIALLYLVCAVPFILAGWAIALLLTHHTERMHRLYAFDLAGAAFGCLIFVPAARFLGAPEAVLATGGVAIFAALLFAWNAERSVRKVAFVAGWALVALVVANRVYDFYDVRVSVGAKQQELALVRWNAFSRVELVGSREELLKIRRPAAAGMSAMLDRSAVVREGYLRYDGDAATEVTNFDGDLRKLTHLSHDVTSTAYHLRRPQRVLVIGAGGGRDVLTALHLGSASVDAVEINPSTIELMRGPLRQFTGALYAGYPHVRVIEGDGRGVVRRSAERYDVIQASLVDTWAASAAGAYALTENSLYTVEAFEDYFDHLTPHGVIAFTRWYGDPPHEVRSVLELAREAFLRRGVRDFKDHVLIVRTAPQRASFPRLGTMVFSRSPFTGEERDQLRDWAKSMHFAVAYDAEQPQRDRDADLFEQAAVGRTSLDDPSFMQPANDDRPFFYSANPVLPWLFTLAGGEPLPLEHLGVGGLTLLVSLATTAVAALLLCGLPLLRRQRVALGPRLARGRALLWIACFAGVGVGYITTEIVLIQRFNLLLGYPAYSLSVVLFSMLLSSGIGSAVAGRHARTLTPELSLLAVCAVLLIGEVLIPAVAGASLGTSTALRIAVVIALVAPLGFFMGMPFPTALRRAGGEAQSLVSWGWAVNGGLSVFGSALSVATSTAYGFATTSFISFSAYVLALIAAVGLSVLPLREYELEEPA